jgi:carboxymethylenebutenolidase
VSKQLTDLQQYLVDEFVEDYQHGHMGRRDALKRIAAVSGSLAFATSLLAACGPVATPTTTTTPAAVNAAAPQTPNPPAATPPSENQPGTGPVGSPVPFPTPPQAVITAAASRPDQPSPTVAPGVRVPPDDPAITAADVSFPSDNVNVLAYLARPKGDDLGPFPAVLVCHENRGLIDYPKDVTRRLAKAGYVALAVDLLSAQGGTDKVSDPAQIPGILGNTPPEQFIAYFQAAVPYLESFSYVRKARIGMVGFCFGGGITWRTITKTPQILAAVPFYGPNPPLEDVPGIQAAVLAIYGELDQRITSGAADIEAAMNKNGKVFEKIIYPGAAHAFHNDTGANYYPAAAQDAWAKTLAWFTKYLA